MNAELPPLPDRLRVYTIDGIKYVDGETFADWYAMQVERERIFLARIAELEADAARYRYLRKAHWSDSPLCVVRFPKKNTILGADLPSGDRLDAAIDAERRIE